MRLVTLFAIICRVYASPLFKDEEPAHGKHKGHGNHGLPPGSSEFWWKIMISSAFVLLGGLFAGWVSSSIRYTSVVNPLVVLRSD
jgi:hypothetical protein